VTDLVDKHVSDQIYACLPSSNVGKSFPQAKGALEVLLQAEVVKAASVPIQHKVESVIELLSNLERGVAPKPGFGLGDTFFETVLARFDYFLEHTVSENGSASAATKQKVLRGPAALRALFQDTEARAKTKPEAITLQELEPIQRMKAKLNKEDCDKLSQWVNVAIKNFSAGVDANSKTKDTASVAGTLGMAISTSGASGSKASSSGEPAKKKGKHGTANSSQELIHRLFGGDSK
jgi:hypothetical protein